MSQNTEEGPNWVEKALSKVGDKVKGKATQIAFNAIGDIFIAIGEGFKEANLDNKPTPTPSQKPALLIKQGSRNIDMDSSDKINDTERQSSAIYAYLQQIPDFRRRIIKAATLKANGLSKLLRPNSGHKHSPRQRTGKGYRCSKCGARL